MEDTIRRAQHGDPAALEQVLADLHTYLGRICGAIALDRGQDALQDTLMIVMRQLPRLRDPAALRAWARRIAVREAVRAASGDRTVPIDPNDLRNLTAPDITDVVDIRAILEGLEPSQRAVLVLRHLEGYSEEETAQLLAVAVGTVKSRSSRARVRFREAWRS